MNVVRVLSGVNSKMKTNYRVLLIIAVFGIVLIKAVVNPFAVGARVAVDGAPSDNLFTGLRWRNIGPFHGGRVSAVTVISITATGCGT